MLDLAFVECDCPVRCNNMAQHLSIRVPWHDHGWDGTICEHPDSNNSCLRLKNIYENRDDANECALCGQCMQQHDLTLRSLY